MTNAFVDQRGTKIFEEALLETFPTILEMKSVEESYQERTNMDNKDRKTPVYLGVLKYFDGAGSKAFIIFLTNFWERSSELH